MRPAIAVTDTHGLIWYARRRWRSLGTEARSLFEAADQGRATIYVPTIVLVEVLEAARRGILDLAHGAKAWSTALFSTGHFFPVELSLTIVLRAEDFHAIRERGDRLIAATAAELGYPLISRDPDIERHTGVRVIW